MKGQRLTALFTAAVLALGLFGCSEAASETTGDTTDATSTTTVTAVEVEGDTRQQLLSALTAKLSGTYALEEQIQVQFEVNGKGAAKSEMTAQLQMKPDASAATCSQTLENGVSTVQLYSTDGRLLVHDGDCRYALSLTMADALKYYGAVPLSAMPDFTHATLTNALTLTETDSGYSLGMTLSDKAITAALSTVANSWLAGVGTKATDGDVTDMALTLTLQPDGTPVKLSYSTSENMLSDGNFATVRAFVDVTFTALGDDVPVTEPDDPASYKSAQNEYDAIKGAVLDKDGRAVTELADVYAKLTKKYDKALVDSVLNMIGLTV